MCFAIPQSNIIPALITIENRSLLAAFKLYSIVKMSDAFFKVGEQHVVLNYFSYKKTKVVSYDAPFLFNIRFEEQLNHTTLFDSETTKRMKS